MGNIPTRSTLPPKPFKWLLLSALFALGVWFLAGELIYAITRDRSGESALRSMVLAAHLIFATPLLLLPPLQFSRRIRLRWPYFHRRVGQLYLASAVVASILAVHLGLTFESLGRRVPLFVFAVLWLSFSIASWVCARRRLFAAHERFVVRSYSMALAFVLVRLMGEAQGLFSFLEDEEISGITREWLSFVLPLLIVEGWHSWWPSMRAVQAQSVEHVDAG